MNQGNKRGQGSCKTASDPTLSVGDLVPCQGAYATVTKIRSHSPGTHTSPIREQLVAIEITTTRGTRWHGRGVRPGEVIDAEFLTMGARYRTEPHGKIFTLRWVDDTVNGMLIFENTDGSTERYYWTSKLYLVQFPPRCHCGRWYERCERECPWPAWLERIYSPPKPRAARYVVRHDAGANQWGVFDRFFGTFVGHSQPIVPALQRARQMNERSGNNP